MDFLSEFKEMENQLGSKEASFSPDEIFKLFSQMSRLYDFQGRLLGKLLKMVASLVSNYSQEQIIKNGVTSAKQPNVSTEIRDERVNQIIEEKPIEPPSFQPLPIPHLSNILGGDSQLEEDQIVRLNQFPSREPMDAPKHFKKKFKKLESNGPECIKKTKLDVTEKPQEQPKQPDLSRLFKQTVRNKEQRKQLPGYLCDECSRFIEGMNLSEKEKEQWCKDCSRHRGGNNVIYQALNLFPSPME